MRPIARRAFTGLQVKDYGLAILSLALFVAALVSGEGPKSFAFLAAAAWWAAFATY
jgi:hypothetical protein